MSYFSLLEALNIKITSRLHRIVLLHIMGYFKKLIDKDEKAELLELIGRYSSEHTPLIVPSK